MYQNSSYIFLGGFCLLALVIFRVWFFKQPGTKRFSNRIFKKYHARSSLFVNKSELMFFKILVANISNQYHVLTKVRLEDVITAKSNLSKKETWELRGRVKSRHIDYLIIDDQGAPLLAIELDGSSHNITKALRSDKFKNRLFSKVGIPLERVVVGQNFRSEIGEIKAMYNL